MFYMCVRAIELNTSHNNTLSVIELMDLTIVTGLNTRGVYFTKYLVTRFFTIQKLDPMGSKVA